MSEEILGFDSTIAVSTPNFGLIPVVLDLNLPRLDGVSILRFLRTRKPSMPILVDRKNKG